MARRLGSPGRPSRLAVFFAPLLTVCGPLSAVPATDGSAADAGREGGDGRDGRQAVCILPEGWRESYPYSLRLAGPHGTQDGPWIDLDAIRFDTGPLVTKGPDGSRVFLDPDLSTFAAELVRAPFALGPTDLFIVQAETPSAQSGLAKYLASNGLQVLGYLPELAYLVRLGEADVKAIASRSEVQWIGLFQPAFRVSSPLDFLVRSEPRRELKLTVHLDRADFETDQEIHDALRRTGFEILDVSRSEAFWVVRLRGAAVGVHRLAAVPGILWAERFVDPVLHNDVARTSGNVTTGRGASAGPIMDVEDVWARGIRGEGQIASAADTGLSTGNLNTLHWDFGQVGVPANPQRVIKGYALGRPATWDDNQTTGGGHGTHTSGSIVGNGIRSGSSPSTNSFGSSHAGTAPKAQFVFQSIMDSGGALGGLPADLNNLFQPPYNDGARVHSNSWGAPVAGQYTTDSMNVDRFAWNHKDMVITFSAGNSGVDTAGADGVVNPDSIGAPGTAKNCITVGASENYRPTVQYEYPSGTCNTPTWSWFNGANFSANPIASDHMANNANGMGAFSSRGPCDDTRIKPDVVAPGIFIRSTRTDVNQAYEQWGICGIPAGEQQYYLNMGGTSMSNPLTAGAATLVRQYYVAGWHGNGSTLTNGAPVPADGFNPSSALVKATLINGAWEMNPGQYGTGGTREIVPGWDTGRTLPNNVEGFGRVDLEHSLFPGSGWDDDPGRLMAVHDVSAGLQTGQAHAYTFDVSSNADPLIVTLVWTDPWAASGAGTKLVNDLNLTVTNPAGTTTYYPNGVDKTSGVDNRNNVEQVKVSLPSSGTWTIDVDGYNVPGNGSGGTTTQPYALVISGVGCQSRPGVPTGLVATPTPGVFGSISLSWMAGSPAGASYNVYRADGACPGGTYSLVASGVATTSYVDSGLAEGVAYSYRVQAIDAGGTCPSASSSCASATTNGTCTLPPAFAGLVSVTPTFGTTCSLSLSWIAGTSRCGGSVTYAVYRSTTSGFAPSTANRIATNVTGTAYVDSSALVSGTPYYYVVRAVDGTNGAEETNTVERSATPGGPATTLTETFEAAGGFDLAGWTHQALSGSTDWTWSTTQSQTPTHSWFSLSQTSVSDRVLASPAITVTASSSLSFWHTYAFEGSTTTCYDAGTLEVSTDGGSSWSVVPDGAFVSGGFTGTANANFSNPIGGRRAWCAGSIGSMTQVQVNLGGTWSGQTIRLRWHEGDDSSARATGWYVDSVTFSNVAGGTCTTSASDVRFFTARATGASGATSGQVKLEWLNPTGSYTGTRILRKTGSAPTGPTDAGATVVIDDNGSFAGQHRSFTDTGRTLGTTYYYAAYVGFSGTYSSGKHVAARPQDTTSATVPVRWVYSTGATNLAAPGIGPSLLSVSNDRIVHATAMGTAGGDWPSTWTPMAMNAPSQGRPLIRQVTVGSATRVAFVGSQDGRVYCVNADTGALVWTSPDLGGPIQGSPVGTFTAYGHPYSLIYVGTRSTSSANRIHALNVSNGTIAWTFDNGGVATPSNAIGIVSGSLSVDPAASRVYFASRARTGGSPDTLWCLSFNASSAAKVWSQAAGDVDGSVTKVGSRLYVGTTGGAVVARNADGTGGWTLPLGDGAVKGFLWPDSGTPTHLYLSTTNRVWKVRDDTSAGVKVWDPGVAVPSPSPAVLWPGASHLLVGSGDGSLYQLDKSGTAGQTAKSVVLGPGTAAVGAVALDVTNGLAHAGSGTGALYAVAVPLP